MSRKRGQGARGPNRQKFPEHLCEPDTVQTAHRLTCRLFQPHSRLAEWMGNHCFSSLKCETVEIDLDEDTANDLDALCDQCGVSRHAFFSGVSKYLCDPENRERIIERLHKEVFQLQFEKMFLPQLNPQGYKMRQE